jgi:DNA-binding NarL/FixJ family response regulator
MDRDVKSAPPCGQVLQLPTRLRHGRKRALSSGQDGKEKIKVLIADSEAIFRIGLKRLLDVEDDLRVVAHTDDRSAALRLSAQFRPEVLFVQSEMLAERPQEFVVGVRRANRLAKVVVTASSVSDDAAVEFTRSGASGVILKSADPALFVKCVRKVSAGEVWLPKRHVAHLAKLLEDSAATGARPADTLTKREKAIVSALVQGWRNRDIGRHLSISEQTVKNHLRSIFDKLGVSDRLELVLYAIHKQLDLPPVK